MSTLSNHCQLTSIQQNKTRLINTKHAKRSKEKQTESPNITVWSDDPSIENTKTKQQEEALTEHAPIQAQTGRGNRRTVEAGHYVVLAAITSKLIGAPERERQKSQREKRGRQEVSLTPRSPPHTRLSPVLPAERLANVSAPKSQSQFKRDRETCFVNGGGGEAAWKQRRWRECLGVKGMFTDCTYVWGLRLSQGLWIDSGPLCIREGTWVRKRMNTAQHNITQQHTNTLTGIGAICGWDFLNAVEKNITCRWLRTQSKIISDPSPVVVHNWIHSCNKIYLHLIYPPFSWWAYCILIYGSHFRFGEVPLKKTATNHFRS